MRRLGFQHADVEEIVFRTYREAWIKAARLRRPDRFEAWLRVIARYIACEYRRGLVREASRRDPAMDGVEMDHLAREDRPDAASAECDDVNRLLAGITAEDRELIEAKYLRRMTLVDIAHRTGLKIHQITYRLRRIKNDLRWSRNGQGTEP